MPPPPSVGPSQLIEMAGEEAIAEDRDSNGGVGIVGKVNLNFGNMKLSDSKKRVRPSGVADAMMQLEAEEEEDESSRKILKAKRIKNAAIPGNEVKNNFNRND